MGVNALEAGASLITDLKTLNQKFPLQNELFDPPFSSFTPSKPEVGQTPVNQLPGDFIFHLDCRLLAPYTLEEVQREVQSIADIAEQRDHVQVYIEPLLGISASPKTPVEAPVVQLLSRAVEAQLKTKVTAHGSGGITSATMLRSAGLPVAVWAKSKPMGLFPNEQISITALLDTSKIFARMLFDPQALKNQIPPD